MCALCGRARAHGVPKNPRYDQELYHSIPQTYFAFKLEFMLIATRPPESRLPSKSRTLAEARSRLRYGGGGLRRFQ